jgi:hypothetical protein
MNAHTRYGITAGQIYRAADGGEAFVRVVDVETHADSDDVVVCDVRAPESPYRIDCFKLAMVRYVRVDEGSPDWFRAHLLDPGLDLYTAVRMARLDFAQGRMGTCFSRLKVDADKLREHKVLYNMVCARIPEWAGSDPKGGKYI